VRTSRRNCGQNFKNFLKHLITCRHGIPYHWENHKVGLEPDVKYQLMRGLPQISKAEMNETIYILKSFAMGGHFPSCPNQMGEVQERERLKMSSERSCPAFLCFKEL